MQGDAVVEPHRGRAGGSPNANLAVLGGSGTVADVPGAKDRPAPSPFLLSLALARVREKRIVARWTVVESESTCDPLSTEPKDSSPPPSWGRRGSKVRWGLQHPYTHAGHLVCVGPPLYGRRGASPWPGNAGTHPRGDPPRSPLLGIFQEALSFLISSVSSGTALKRSATKP